MSVLTSALRRRAWCGLRLAVAPSTITMATAAAVSVGIRTRHFWNPFADRAANSAAGSDGVGSSHRISVQHQRIVEKAHRDATLYNERLLDACLDLLSFCRGGGETVDAASADMISQLVEVMLHDFRRSPADQFDLVYAALCLPVSASNAHVRRCLMVILEAVLPEVLYRVFESADLVVVGHGPESVVRRDALLVFVHALLGSERAEVPEGLESEEVVLVYLDDVRAAFPALDRNAAFTELKEGATGIALRAKVYVLLSRLCAEFDSANTGKVALQELRETAVRVLGAEQAAMLLDGAQPDGEGKIRYQQLTALLTRPPPRREK